jgi:uncharacterized membrane protein YeaQ/YmgE (transglycosylase-associated protein family)
MHFLYFLLVGMFVGWLAGLIVKGRGFGVLGDIVVGVIGAYLGGFLAGLVGIQPITGLGALAMSVVGAIVLLAIVKAVRKI